MIVPKPGAFREYSLRQRIPCGCTLVVRVGKHPTRRGYLGWKYFLGEEKDATENIYLHVKGFCSQGHSPENDKILKVFVLKVRKQVSQYFDEKLSRIRSLRRVKFWINEAVETNFKVINHLDVKELASILENL